MDQTTYPRNRMSEPDLDRELASLKERYGDSRTQASNRGEQELAKVFARSGWTQEELAAKVGKDRTWVARRLTLGRFLDFVPMGTNLGFDLSDLSERRFREAWSKTEKSPNERHRFQQVLEMLANDDTQAVKKRKIAIRKEMIAAYGNGKWHPLETLVEHFPDDDPEDVKQVVDRLGWESSKHLCTMEKKPVGRSFKVRIFKTTERNVSSTELKEELAPIIEELIVEGRRSTVTMSPPAVALLANRLKQLLAKWVDE